MSPSSPAKTRALLARAQGALGVSQGRIGILAYASERTGQRWATGRAAPIPEHFGHLAAAVYPVDPALAAELAAAGDTTLVALGLEKPPEPPPPPAPPAPDAASPRAPSPALPLQPAVDSIVCAAADAVDLLPKQLRPALLAAVMRAKELGIDLETMETGLRPAKGPSTKEKSRQAAKKIE
jgi:hypothetical protein